MEQVRRHVGGILSAGFRTSISYIRQYVGLLDHFACDTYTLSIRNL
jgi:hypothetical protein